MPGKTVIFQGRECDWKQRLRRCGTCDGITMRREAGAGWRIRNRVAMEPGCGIVVGRSGVARLSRGDERTEWRVREEVDGGWTPCWSILLSLRVAMRYSEG